MNKTTLQVYMDLLFYPGESTQSGPKVFNLPPSRHTTFLRRWINVYAILIYL